MRLFNPDYPVITVRNVPKEMKEDIVNVIGDKSAYVSDYIRRLVKQDIKNYKEGKPSLLRKAV